jgi:DNA-binding FadR family transcriptional regulator
MITLQGKWEEFDRDLLPFLLQVESAELEDEGDVVEVYMALYRAVRWYATKSITPEQRAAFTAAMDNMRKNAKPRESKA